MHLDGAVFRIDDPTLPDAADAEVVRARTEKLVSRGTTMVTTGQLPFTPRARQVRPEEPAIHAHANANALAHDGRSRKTVREGVRASEHVALVSADAHASGGCGL